MYDYLVENYFEVKDQRLTGMKLIATAVVEAQALLKEKDNKICMLETSIAVKDQQISELKPKASYYDVVLNCPDLLSTTKIAKTTESQRSGLTLISMIRKYNTNKAECGFCIKIMRSAATQAQKLTITMAMMVFSMQRYILTGHKKADYLYTKL